MLPLAGITVVALEQAVAVPFATRQLADLGARVIKIERPGAGDFARHYDETTLGMSSHFVWLNRSKESLSLDLKHPEANAIIHGLLATADVFVQNLAPGAAQRLGLGSSALTSRYPRLIACSLSGYGESGPYRDKKAYDLLVQCETGLVSITGSPETPSKVGISAADIAAGMYAYSGILAALPGRAILTRLGDWLPRDMVASGIFLSQLVGLLLLLRAPGSVGVIGFAILYGAGFGSVTPARAALVAEYYGPAHYGNINGTVAFILYLARAIAPLAAGLVYEATGGYQVVFWSLVGALALASALMLLGGSSRKAETAH